MRSEFAYIDTGDTAAYFKTLLDAGFRVFVWRTVDMAWEQPVCLDGYDSQTLTLIGANQLHCNVQRAFEGDLPCLYAHDSEWRIHDQGVNWLGNPSASDATVPLVSFGYLDRSSFRDMGAYAGRIALGRYATGKLGNGYCSQTVFDHIEGHRSPCEAWDIWGFRKLTFMGECSFERNGLIAPRSYVGLSLIGDSSTPDRGQSIVTGCRFEHDDDAHVGLRIRDAGCMSVGYNRLMRAGMDAECFATDWHPDMVYGDRTMHRRAQISGAANRWIGREQYLTGSMFNKKLVWAPESEFDQRYA